MHGQVIIEWKRRMRNSKKEHLTKKMERKVQKKIQTVIYEEHTDHSTIVWQIRDRLKEMEKIIIVRVKIVERTGGKFVELLRKSNAWASEDWLREDCMLCTSTGENWKKGDCKRLNVTYEPIA